MKGRGETPGQGEDRAHARGADDARRGLRWDRGGWLGSQLGGSCWIGVAALLTLPHEVGVGLVVLALFAAANLAGLLLWRRRERLSPYAGIQLLLGAIGLCGFAAIFVLDRAGLFEQIQVGGQVSAWTTYLVLAAVVLGLMLFFRLRVGRASGARR